MQLENGRADESIDSMTLVREMHSLSFIMNFNKFLKNIFVIFGQCAEKGGKKLVARLVQGTFY